jgi:serine/threonine protein kinase
LADFGIAVALDDPRLTVTGAVVGTPGYVAPKVAAGAAPDLRQDLWSVAVLTRHLLTGVRPGTLKERRFDVGVVMNLDTDILPPWSTSSTRTGVVLASRRYAGGRTAASPAPHRCVNRRSAVLSGHELARAQARMR